mgnify:CR=1 FL=1
MLAFILASATPMRFGYILVLAVGGGMTVGLPLYRALHRPLIHTHLTHLDLLLIVMAILLLLREALAECLSGSDGSVGRHLRTRRRRGGLPGLLLLLLGLRVLLRDLLRRLKVFTRRGARRAALRYALRLAHGFCVRVDRRCGVTGG